VCPHLGRVLVVNDRPARRNVPGLSQSLLLTNFTGPPGLLLYFLICVVSGRGLPPPETAPPLPPATRALSAGVRLNAGELVELLWAGGGGRVGWSAAAVAAGAYTRSLLSST
jgi:hypothetical protein